MLDLREKGQARCVRPAEEPLLPRPKRGVRDSRDLRSRLSPRSLHVPAFRRPGPISRSVIALVALLATVLAACGAAATPRPTTPPDATGSLLPPETATPPASPSASAAPAFPVTLTDDEGTKV